MANRWAEATVLDIQAELARDDAARNQKGLAVTGLEPFLSGLAIKVLVGVLTSAATAAAKKGAVELLKSVTKPKDLNELEAELVSLKGLLREEGVATVARLRRIEDQLVAEGVPPEEAARMAARIATVIERNVAK